MTFTDFREKRRTTAGRMCTGKRSYRFKDEAERHRERLIGLSNVVDPERLESYCCLYCWNWHVGHTPKTKVTM